MLNGKFGWLDYAAGYLTQMKPRNADDFISMSEAAGAAGTNEGAVLAGVRLEPRRSLWVAANTVFTVNTFNTAFVETQYTHAFGRDVSLSAGAQYTDQRSVGQEIFGRFQTWSVGARVSLDAYGACISPSFHRTGSGDNIQTPYGRWPGYLKLITKDFDLARQTALGIRLEYDAGRVGAPGLVGGGSSSRAGSTPSTRRAGSRSRTSGSMTSTSPTSRRADGSRASRFACESDWSSKAGPPGCCPTSG